MKSKKLMQWEEEAIFSCITSAQWEAWLASIGWSTYIEKKLKKRPMWLLSTICEGKSIWREEMSESHLLSLWQRKSQKLRESLERNSAWPIIFWRKLKKRAMKWSIENIIRKLQKISHEIYHIINISWRNEENEEPMSQKRRRSYSWRKWKK